MPINTHAPIIAELIAAELATIKAQIMTYSRKVQKLKKSNKPMDRALLEPTQEILQVLKDRDNALKAERTALNLLFKNA
jgi:nicotinate-nucleotide pyrophosphorylase